MATKKLMTIFILLVCIFVSFSPSSIYAIFGINLFRAYDINLRPPRWKDKNFQWTNWVEIGYKARAFNPEGDSVNVMQLWTPKQDAIAMLEGFPADSPITQFLNNVLDNPQDNGIRGNFKVTGNFEAKGVGFGARYHFAHDVTFGILWPFYDMRLSNVNFMDCTQDVTQEDLIVKEELTSQLKERIAQFDPNLNLHGWHRRGFGDLFFMAEWYRDFPQGKRFLKNVALNVRTAMQVPTGLKTNIDDILSIPFGCDGSVGLLFGAGINLKWFDVIPVRGGIDVQFLYLFGNTQERRIKVQQNQTDFLLLAKADAFKDFGFTQRFNLFLELYQIIHGLSARAAYNFWKHGEDTLTLCTNMYSNNIANTAQSLQEWTIHQFIFQLLYDFQVDFPNSRILSPQISLFYKLPFNGQRSIVQNSYGASLTLNF